MAPYSTGINLRPTMRLAVKVTSMQAHRSRIPDAAINDIVRDGIVLLKSKRPLNSDAISKFIHISSH